MKGILLCGVVLAIALGAIACVAQLPAGQTVSPQQTIGVPGTVSPTKAQNLAAIQAAFKLSPHSNDYGEGRGPNTYCARCHSPRNWDPKAVPGPLPNCMACKFPFDKQVRVPPPNTNVFIAQKDWKNIDCDICHRVDSSGTVDPKPAIWNQASGMYEAVATSTELCEKCHLNSLGGSQHKMDLSGPAHLNQIGVTKHRPDACTDCHDPHSTQASCTQCHSALSKIAGHDAAHAKVACQACHDATGMPTIKDGPKDPKDPTGEWITYRLTASGAGGPPSYAPLVSHNLTKTVDCTRCHYPNNAEGLQSLVTPTATRAATAPAASATPAATPTR